MGKITEDPPLLVIGAGIGGMGAALALSRRGHRVLVLEQAPEIGEIGAGIQLAPNALRVLDALGVLHAVQAAAVTPPAASLRDATSGRQLARLNFDQAFRERYGYGYIVTHRTDLHASLVSASKATGLVEIRVDSKAIAVEQEVDDVTVRLESGESIVGRALIGADGLHSVVRQYVAGDDELIHSGDFAFRGTVPFGNIADRDGKNEVTWWIGESMHLMQYPLRAGELFNQVAVFHCATSSADLQTPGDPELFDRLFSDKHALVQQGVDEIDRSRIWPIVDRDPIKNWTIGRVTLLGDAAHPMVQYLAQGACQALEDVGCLADAVDSRPDVLSAFKAYQEKRLRVTATVQTWARRMGQIVHADGLTAQLRDELLCNYANRVVPQVDWLYGSSRAAFGTDGSCD